MRFGSELESEADSPGGLWTPQGDHPSISFKLPSAWPCCDLEETMSLPSGRPGKDTCGSCTCMSLHSNLQDMGTLGKATGQN